MVSVERSKKKAQLWQKAIVHFLLCFVMGFFTGIAPTGKSSVFTSTQAVASTTTSSEVSPDSLKLSSFDQKFTNQSPFNESLVTQLPKRSNIERDEEAEEAEEEGDFDDLNAKRLVIIVTPTSAKDEFRGVLLSRLANTLKLVAPPLLWVVVEQQIDSSDVSEILRKTGVMYRHLVFKENISDPEAEMDHQRNVALSHIEHHRLSGIVHFAGLANVYDLNFFNEIRATEGFGTWPMAFLSANRKRVVIEGPVCDSSDVIGWHLRKRNNSTDTSKSPIHISSFAFNSSILWDPERWGRPSSIQDNSQNSVKFVEKEVLEEETKLKGIPSEGCSKVLLWNLHIPTKTAANLF